MLARLLILLYAVVSYGLFVVSFGYAVGFVGNFLVPLTLDSGRMADPVEAVIVNLLLLTLFALQHSIMARPAFKRWWAGVLPVACQRSTYVLLSSLILLLIFWQWRPIPAAVWQTEGVAAWLLTGLFWCGWAIALASTYMIDHFDMFGLRQALAAWRETTASHPSFMTPLFYRLVRHPLMFGLLLAFWATPVMTVGHLLFAIMNTLYVLFGVQLEERDLIAEFPSYRQYRRQVPMLLPRLFGRRGLDGQERAINDAAGR